MTMTLAQWNVLKARQLGTLTIQELLDLEFLSEHDKQPDGAPSVVQVQLSQTDIQALAAAIAALSARSTLPKS